MAKISLSSGGMISVTEKVAKIFSMLADAEGSGHLLLTQTYRTAGGYMNTRNCILAVNSISLVEGD